MMAFYNKKLLFTNDSRADLWRDTVAELQSNSANLSVAKDKPKEHRYKPQLPCFVACPDSIFALQASISVITTCLVTFFCFSGKHSLSFSLALLPLFASQASILSLFRLPCFLFLPLRQAFPLFLACLTARFLS